MTILPAYARLPNDALGTPPLLAGDALMHAMLVKGNKAAQQRYCDAALNGFPDSRYRFEVIGDNVLVTAMYVREMRSLDPLERNNGSVGETDIAFWSIVRCTSVDTGEPDRFMWLPSFMFVDSGAAMASGREIYGYPKFASEIGRTDLPDDRAAVAVSMLHFARFGPAERAAHQPICEISDDPSATWAGPAALAGDGPGDAFKRALHLEELENLPSLPLPQFGVPQVCLRQFRDPARSGAAALKEIIVTTPRVRDLAGSGPLGPGHMLRIHPSASHDIRRTMGLPEVSEVTLGAWLRFSFEIGWAVRLVP